MAATKRVLSVMRHVRLDPIIDPTEYLGILKGVAPRLPPGARAFATDAQHYDFYSPRCVKDLSVLSLECLDSGESVDVRLHLKANPSKHDADLLLDYFACAKVTLEVKPSRPLGHHRLGQVVLDELLPEPEGCRHEIAFTGGVLALVSRDVRARWVAAGAG